MFQHPLYQTSPIWLQERMIGARARIRRALREGSRFHEILREVEASQWYDQAEMRRLQLERLRRMLTHAYENVPYYARAWRKQGISPRDVGTIDDMARLPTLDKACVLQNLPSFVARGYRGPRIAIHTSGSTGTPLRLVQTLDAVISENAFVWRQLGWAGYKDGEPRAWIRGDMVVPFEQRQPPFWRLNRTERTLMFSSYHLAPQTADLYLEALEEFDPVLIQAYPSSIGYLAKYLQVTGRKYRGESLRAVVTSSETLTETDRRQVEESLGCKVFDYYGNAERVSLIQSCEQGKYHLASDYSLVELEPRESRLFEIVGTSFFNRLMPLIRYRTGDLVEIDASEGRCRCKRALPIVRSIIGRMDDYILTRDGRRVGRLDHIFKGIGNIAAGQLVQNEIDELVIRLVAYAGFGAQDRAKLVEQARQRVGADMKIRVELVADIPRTRNGKFQAVVCNVREHAPIPTERQTRG